MRQLKITKQVTNRETASLDKYLQEIRRLVDYSEEEVELAQRIRAGAKLRLTNKTKLAVCLSVAKQYKIRVSFELDWQN